MNKYISYTPKEVKEYFSLNNEWSVIILCKHNDMYFIINRNYSFIDSLIKSEECDFWEIGNSFYALQGSNFKILEYVNLPNYNRKDQTQLNELKQKWVDFYENKGIEINKCIDACVDKNINNNIGVDISLFRKRMRKRYKELKSDYDKLINNTNKHIVNIHKYDFLLDGYFREMLHKPRITYPNQNKLIDVWYTYYPIFMINRDELRDLLDNKTIEEINDMRYKEYCELIKEKQEYLIFNKEYMSNII